LPNQSTEDYVKNIYKLQREGEKVTTSALAESLQLSDPSITDMIKKLSEKGFVRYTPYKGVELTNGGTSMAMKILRRHRLWEMFLVRYLGYSWDQIHEEAERLEHVTSDLLEQRLDELLGHPSVDPHGDPIPSVDGCLHQPLFTALADCEAGDVVSVTRVSDDEPRILQHATRLGVGLQTRLLVRERMAFDGSMTLELQNREVFVSREVAEAIFVEKV
jgi:DtxR family transcriptional regulator, Mn-dependent transcriptional regulator